MLNREINRLKRYDFSIKKHSAFAVIEINDLVEGYLNEDWMTKPRKSYPRLMVM